MYLNKHNLQRYEDYVLCIFKIVKFQQVKIICRIIYI
jgi:hypothetical protein